MIDICSSRVPNCTFDVDARVSAMFTSAITDLLDDCSDWPVVVIATTTSLSSLTISLHDLFVHCTEFDVCLCLSLCLSLYVCLCVFVCVHLCPLSTVTCHGITQCYLPHDTSELALPNSSQAGWYSIYLPLLASL